MVVFEVSLTNRSLVNRRLKHCRFQMEMCTVYETCDFKSLLMMMSLSITQTPLAKPGRLTKHPPGKTLRKRSSLKKLSKRNVPLGVLDPMGLGMMKTRRLELGKQNSLL